MEPIKYYSERIEFYAREKQRLESSSQNISILRVICFAVFLILIVFLANLGLQLAMAGSILLFLLLFSLLLKQHARVRVTLRRAANLESINKEEVQRLEYHWENFDEGREWIERSHLYTYDLDIFGKNSVFQLLNRTVTPAGKETLANWLKKPVKKSIIIERQQAVEELEKDQEWNQEIQAAGRMTEAGKKDLEKLTGWLDDITVIPNRFYKWIAYISPLLLLIAVLFVILGTVSIYLPIALLVINGIILGKFKEQVYLITEATSGGVKLLGAFGTMIRLIEMQEFSSSLLKHLKEPFEHGAYSASTEIGRLGRLLDFLNARSNMFYKITNLFFLTDIQLVNRAARWKSQNQRDMSKWFEHIAILESLISLAGYSRANPDYVNPMIDQETVLMTSGLGHPLIPPARRIANDFHIDKPGDIMLITGSNMSGKSTFLRTLGVNTVLALMGAKVPARSFRIKEMQVFTGMRSEDNLEENISSFYAELKRIRQLLDTIQSSSLHVFYMLDEILKGTNTKDRHKGSEALIRQLLGGKAAGLISTHDLELGQLAEDQEAIHNYSFNSRIEDNEIVFDYKIQPGLCHSFNASKLMEKLGILTGREHSPK